MPGCFLVGERVGEVHAVLAGRDCGSQGEAGTDGYNLASPQVGLHGDIGRAGGQGEAHEAEHSRAGRFQVGPQGAVGGIGEAHELGGGNDPLRYVDLRNDHHLPLYLDDSCVLGWLVDGNGYGVEQARMG